MLSQKIVLTLNFLENRNLKISQALRLYLKFGVSRVLCNLKKICEFFIQNLYNLISTTENIDKFESYLRAKHTKDSKEFACSTLTLCHLSRAILSKKLRWARSSPFSPSAPHLLELEFFEWFAPTFENKQFSEFVGYRIIR